DGDATLGVLEQRDCQANRQVHGVRAIDFFAQLQLFDHDLIFGIEFAVDDAVVQVEVQATFANAVTGKFARIGGQGRQFHAFELRGDVQAGQGVEWVQAADDGHRRIAVNIAAHINGCRLWRSAVDGADLAVELLQGGG